MLSIVNKGFSKWLQSELDKQEWTQADLARKTDLSRAAVSLVLSKNRKPGPDFCRAIAHALDLPEEEVFRQAGLLSPKLEDPPGLGEWIRMYVLADEEERDRMLEIAKTLSQRSRKE
jgi:transcriptional regulator with XRE-family HTH domain